MKHPLLVLGSFVTGGAGIYVVAVNAKGPSRDVLLFGLACLVLAWALAMPARFGSVLAAIAAAVKAWRNPST